ncbi:MAG: transcriptional regulator [Flavobacteriaceae bacterium]|jgi:DNA-binding transcriptional ArsR family regulator|tara:strand:- start:923 stop:1210 length:288 start_codon:yes stop_codon:yes gene_type:complete
MNKDIEKLLFNPIRLKTISFLMTVETCTFKALLDITASSKGNLSIQLKKLNEADLIKIHKYFQKSYPTTDYSITKKGKKSFEEFFNELQSYKINK